MKHILILSITLLLFSCGTQKVSEYENDFYSIKNNSPDNIELSGRVIADVQGQNVDLRTKIYINKRESVLMEMKAFLGITAARIFSDENSFKAFNLIENKLYTGKPIKENFEKAVDINLSFDDLMSLVRNEPGGEISEFKIAEKIDDNNILYYRYFKDDYIEYVKFNFKEGYITQYQQKNNDNELLLNVFFSEPIELNKKILPKEISCNLPNDKGSIKFMFDEIKLVDSFDRDLDFDVPKSIERIDLNN